MTKSEQSDSDSVLVKLRKVQQELKVPKNQFNSFGKYNFRNLEDIVEAVKPLCFKHNITLTISDDVVEKAGLPCVEATATVVDDNDRALSAKAYAGIDVDKKGMDASQRVGAASSYARKYALNGLFLIDDTRDADNNENHPAYNKQSQPAAPPPKRTKPEPISKDQVKLMYSTLHDKGCETKEQATEFLNRLLETDYPEVKTLSALTKAQATGLLNKILATDGGVIRTFFGGSENNSGEEGPEQ